MNLIQQRRLAKLAKLNAQEKASKPANKGAKGIKPVMSKMRQKLQEQKAASEKRAAEKLVVKEAAENPEGDKIDDLEIQVDGVEGSVDELKTDLENQGEKTDELAGTVDELSNDLDNVKDDVSNLDDRVDWVENDIEKIKEKLEDDSEYIGNPELETHKVILAAYKDEMLNIEDIPDRLSYKAEAVKRIENFVDGYVKSAVSYPNTVAVWMVIWLFDLGDIVRAMPLALHLAKQKTHRMPTRFSSSIYQFVCDQMYDWANAQLVANKSAGPYLDDLIKTIEQDQWKLSDIVHGKMYAIYGKHLEALGEDEVALNAFEKAMKLNSKAGVKKKIERLTATLAKTVNE